jgi:hypothetical protein
MRALVKTFGCLSCGCALSADSLRLADEAWSKYMADLDRDHGGAGIRFRVEKTFDAICPNCGAHHKFDGKRRTFVLTRS